MSPSRELLEQFARAQSIQCKGGAGDLPCWSARGIPLFSPLSPRGAWRKIKTLSTRLKLLGISLLLCVALASVIFAAVSTVQAYQQLAQKHQNVMAGDVSTISSWMTIPYIARVYHVPAACLSQSLHITSPTLQQHANLRVIANYYRRPLDSVLNDVRNTIKQYREKHLICHNPVPPSFHFSHYPPAWWYRKEHP